MSDMVFCIFWSVFIITKHDSIAYARHVDANVKPLEGARDKDGVYKHTDPDHANHTDDHCDEYDSCYLSTQLSWRVEVDNRCNSFAWNLKSIWS